MHLEFYLAAATPATRTYHARVFFHRPLAAPRLYAYKIDPKFDVDLLNKHFFLFFSFFFYIFKSERISAESECAHTYVSTGNSMCVKARGWN